MGAVDTGTGTTSMALTTAFRSTVVNATLIPVPPAAVTGNELDRGEFKGAAAARSKWVRTGTPLIASGNGSVTLGIPREPSSPAMSWMIS